jgi:hypothetical protein
VEEPAIDVHVARIFGADGSRAVGLYVETADGQALEISFSTRLARNLVAELIKAVDFEEPRQ